ncbi:hypothetical protein StoSoilB13_19080 [Arthrobacter sp. StoSoilB13]|nr:hypothetical protein StoSoilB13_19080 [Arthrobacter sp. StoSoilB13]
MDTSLPRDAAAENPAFPLRLMLLTHSYWPEHSPPQRRWLSLTREFRKAGWDVDVVAPVAHYPNGKRDLPRRKAGFAFAHQEGPRTAKPSGACRTFGILAPRRWHVSSTNSSPLSCPCR